MIQLVAPEEPGPPHHHHPARRRQNPRLEIGPDRRRPMLHDQRGLGVLAPSVVHQHLHHQPHHILLGQRLLLLLGRIPPGRLHPPGETTRRGQIERKEPPWPHCGRPREIALHVRLMIVEQVILPDLDPHPRREHGRPQLRRRRLPDPTQAQLERVRNEPHQVIHRPPERQPRLPIHHGPPVVTRQLLVRSPQRIHVRPPYLAQLAVRLGRVALMPLHQPPPELQERHRQRILRRARQPMPALARPIHQQLPRPGGPHPIPGAPGPVHLIQPVHRPPPLPRVHPRRHLAPGPDPVWMRLNHPHRLTPCPQPRPPLPRQRRLRLRRLQLHSPSIAHQNRRLPHRCDIHRHGQILLTADIADERG